MSLRGFHTITLGCKLNQFDGAAIETELRRRGLRHEADPSAAGVVVVNTCTVTGKADAEARRLIRRLRRTNPTCRLLVTGCYAELAPSEVATIPGVDRVFGNRDKGDLGRILDALGIGAEAPPVPERRRDRPFGERGRAFLKVQEGCDLRCSYCVIPSVRGPSRSVAPERISASLRDLIVAGYREIVLTGVNTGDYGRDLVPRTRLAGLIARLLDECGPSRLRLNSLEPLAVTDEIIGAMAREPRLAPHLQVPLQSGSAAVLRRMRRNYAPSTWLDRVERVREAVPHAALGADVIVGFPGETGAEFEETLELVGRSPLGYLHVFAWSPRPGTEAASLPGRVPLPIVRSRSARLRELGARLADRFRRGFEGKVLDAVVLGRSRTGDAARALTGNFIEVRLERGEVEPMQPVLVRVTRVTGEATFGDVVGSPDWALG